MTHEPKRLQVVVAAASPPDLPVTFRPMFGGIMAYADGKPFASLSNAGLALKLSGAARAEMLEVPGAAPLRYEPDAPASKTYVLVPAAMLADQDQLRAWIARGAASLPSAMPRRRGAKPA